MRKSSLILAMCFWATLLSGQTSNSDIKSSPVGKLIYGPYPKDIKKVSTLFNLLRKGNDPDIKDILLLDHYISWPVRAILSVRIIKFNDGRVVIISHDTDRPHSFYVIIEYLNENQFNPDKVVECRVDPEGSIIEFSTKHGIDPNGKDGIVFSNWEKLNERSEILKKDQNIIETNDPLLKRCQSEVDEVFLLLKNGKLIVPTMKTQ